MEVKVCERCKPTRVYKNIKRIDKKEFHIFITDEDGDIYIHELEDVERIEVNYERLL